MLIISGQFFRCFFDTFFFFNSFPFFFFSRYLQQLVTAQGARNRELEQELRAYRRSSDSAGGSIDSGSPKMNGYHHQHHQHHQPQRKSSGTIGGVGTTSTPSSSDGGKEDVDDVLMLHDGVDGIGSNGVIEFGSYAGGEGRAGGLPSMPEGDDEVDDDDSLQQQHHHHHQHHQHPHQHDVEVDMMGMNMMGGAGEGVHFDGMDCSSSTAATAESLRGRTRVRGPATTTITAADKNTMGGGVLKEEEDVDDAVVLVGGGGGGFGMGRSRAL